MLERAIILLEQHRYDLAEKDLRQHLAEYADDAHAYALLALCLLRQDDIRQAQDVINQAIALDPEHAFSFYIQNNVKIEQKDFNGAWQAIHAAISIEPECSTYYGGLAYLLICAEQWEKALNAANQGLSHNPTDSGCLHYRTIALIKLNYFGQAKETAVIILRENPNSADAHNSIGWAALYEGEYKKALEHFSKALHSDPNKEWAREGLVEALKAHYWLYRVMLQFSLLISIIPPVVRVVLVLIALGFMKGLDTAGKETPEINNIMGPTIVILFFLFAILMVIIKPMFNLILSFNKFGRYSMSHRERRQGYIFGFLTPIVLVGIFITMITEDIKYSLLSIMMIVSASPFSYIFINPQKKASKQAIVFSIYLPVLAAAIYICYALGIKTYAMINVFIVSLIFYGMAGQKLGLRYR